MTDLVIQETYIRRDDDGRYCLNDLHRASGGHKRHRPGYWLTNAQTKALAAELKGGAGNPAGPIATLNDGINNGTYVAKELVYAYAMWISPAFALKVIRTYDALVQAQIDKLNDLSHRRARAEIEYLEAEAEASRCGFGLRKWRDVGPALTARLQALRDESQPGLFLN
jgi:hypothetical protein